MIYAYFGSKDALFDAVLDRHVAEAQAAVQMDAYDLEGYAVALFDFYAQRPILVRLALWQELELGRNVSTIRRASDAVTARIAAIEEAQRAGAVTAEVPAGILFDQVQAIAVGNLVGHGVDWTAQRRRYVGQAVARLVRSPG
jgi:AcrR family transcriptional regulator